MTTIIGGGGSLSASVGNWQYLLRELLKKKWNSRQGQNYEAHSALKTKWNKWKLIKYVHLLKTN